MTTEQRKEDEPKSEIEILQLDNISLQEQCAYLRKVNEEKEKSYQNLVTKYKEKIEVLRIDYDSFKQRYIDASAKQSVQIQRLEEIIKAADEVVKAIQHLPINNDSKELRNILVALEHYNKLKI